MDTIDRRRLLAAAAATLAWPHARAQGDSLRWVVPYPPGGGTDVLARALSEAMRADLGMPVVVENKPGAATQIGALEVARAAPDGHTVLQADNAVMAFNEHLFGKPMVDAERDFSYIGGIGKFPLALVVTPQFPARTFREFLAYVRGPIRARSVTPAPATARRITWRWRCSSCARVPSSPMSRTAAQPRRCRT